MQWHKDAEEDTRRSVRLDQAVFNSQTSQGYVVEDICPTLGAILKAESISDIRSRFILFWYYCNVFVAIIPTCILSYLCKSAVLKKMHKFKFYLEVRLKHRNSSSCKMHHSYMCVTQ